MAGFSLHPFVVINHNREDNRFCESVWRIIEPKGGFWRPSERVVGLRREGGLLEDCDLSSVVWLTLGSPQGFSELLLILQVQALARGLPPRLVFWLVEPVTCDSGLYFVMKSSTKYLSLVQLSWGYLGEQKDWEGEKEFLIGPADVP